MLLKPAVVVAWMCVLSCGRCGGRLHADGSTPYVRCLAADFTMQPRRLGSITLEAVDRAVVVKGLPKEPRIGFFQGPGMPTEFRPADLAAAVEAVKPDLLFMIGGLGTDAATASKLLGALASLGPPVLFVAGGRDVPGGFTEAVRDMAREHTARLVDVTAAHVVDLGHQRLVPVAGAQDGRQGISDDACGFGADDLGRRRVAAGGESPALLVSWEIPSAAFGGTRIGSTALEEWRDSTGVTAGVYAWPDLAVARPTSRAAGELPWNAAAADMELTVPRLVGPPHEREDGTRVAPGLLLVRATDAGWLTEAPR